MLTTPVPDFVVYAHTGEWLECEKLYPTPFRNHFSFVKSPLKRQTIIVFGIVKRIKKRANTS